MRHIATETVTRWQDVPPVENVPERSEPGTWHGAMLVTDYFSVEYRLTPIVKWRAPRSRPSALRTLRKRLAAARAAFGITTYGPEMRLERGC